MEFGRRQLPRHVVMTALAEFSALGGASIELIAWEFDRSPADFQGLWDELITMERLEPCGTDPVFGEQMYRLAEIGDGSGAPLTRTAPRQTQTPRPTGS